MARSPADPTPIPESRSRRSAVGRGSVFRWQCRCQDPPVLLATYDPDGRVNIKVRDRYWHVKGQVQTICPRCGAEHILDLREPDSDAADLGPRPAATEPPPAVAKS